MARRLFVALISILTTLSFAQRVAAIQFSNYVSVNRLHLNTSFISDSLQKPSVLTLKVFAMNIGQPVAAAVTITSRLTNRFKRYNLPNGRLEEAFTQPDQLEIQVSAPGFISISRYLTIEVSPVGKVYEFDVELNKSTFSLTVRGEDSQTRQPILGIRFTLTGPALAAPVILTLDPLTGSAKANLPSKGTFQLTSTAVGYNDFTRVWVVEKDHSDVLFKLKPIPTVAAVKPVVDTTVVSTTGMVTPRVNSSVRPEVRPGAGAVDSPVALATIAHVPVATQRKHRVDTTTAKTTAVASPNSAPRKTIPLKTTPMSVASPKTALPKMVPPKSIPTEVALTGAAAASVGAVTTKTFGVVEKGKRIQLNQLYFDQSSPLLRPESHTELDQLYKLLTENLSLRIEVRGHTDNQGDFDANVQLSRERCQAVVDYLSGKGISKDRLKIAGRGPIDAIVPNNNEENRKKNRRVEFVVL